MARTGSPSQKQGHPVYRQHARRDSPHDSRSGEPRGSQRITGEGPRSSRGGEKQPPASRGKRRKRKRRRRIIGRRQREETSWEERHVAGERPGNEHGVSFFGQGKSTIAGKTAGLKRKGVSDEGSHLRNGSLPQSEWQLPRSTAARSGRHWMGWRAERKEFLG